MSVWANQEVFEGTVNGTSTITLARRSRRLVITNDSGLRDLQFKFNDAETYATLKPTETISMEFSTVKVLLATSGGSAAYRIWVHG